MSDQIFYLAYIFYSNINTAIKYYSICKIIISLYLICFNSSVQEYSLFIVWLFGLIAISFVQFNYHSHIGNIILDVNTFLSSAKNTGHLRVFPHNSNIQNQIQQYVHETYDFFDERNMVNQEQKGILIANQIESQIQIHFNLQRKKIFMIIGYLIIQIFGIVLYAYFGIQRLFLTFVLALGMFQYIKVTLAIIVLPFFLLEKLYQYYKKIKLLRILSQKSYSKQMQLEACPICMIYYSYGDKVVILSCNKSHNFHSRCIKNWVKQCENQLTCPMCRAHIS